MKRNCIASAWILLSLISPGDAQTFQWGDVVEAKLTPSVRKYCYMLQISGGWQYQRHTERGQALQFRENIFYEFRIEGVLGTWFLVGALEKWSESQRYYASNHFRVKISDPTSPLLPVSQKEWDAATVVALAQKSVVPPQPSGPEIHAAKFGGFEFRKTGAHFAFAPYGSRLSADSAWLVLQSHTDRRRIPNQRDESSVFWDVFNATTSEKLLTIEGTYSGWGDDPSEAMGRSGWVTERYFIIPLGEHIERCLVCEFGKAQF